MDFNMKIGFSFEYTLLLHIHCIFLLVLIRIYCLMLRIHCILF
ncbi:hypothetical protein LINGRAHAP2_LOCUS24835 [Linum grandiflorum]